MSIVLRFHIWFFMIIYYKLRQILLQNATAILLQKKKRQKFITKSVRFFIAKCDSFITKCDSYYKLRRFYYKMRQLLQNATFITNCYSTFVCHIWTVTFNPIFTMHLRFSRTTLDKNIFVTLSDCLLKRMQKQGSMQRCIRYIFNKIFGKFFNAFNAFADTAVHFIKRFSLPWIRTIHIHVCLLHSQFLLFTFCLFLCLFVQFVSSVFVSIYFWLSMFLSVGIFYYNLIIVQYLLLINWYLCI